MELKKKEIIKERQYAKKGEISKNELKKNSPQKWLIASSLGIVSLFYSNPKSVFGTIGVVFGCIELEATNTTPLFNTINNISEAIAKMTVIMFYVSAIMCFIFMIDYVVLTIKKVPKEDKEKSVKNWKKLILIMILIVVLLLCVHLFLDNGILELNIPAFYEGGTPIHDIDF